MQNHSSFVEDDGPRVLPVESGPVRIQQLWGAEREPAWIGLGCLAMMFFLALYGQWAALKGLWIWAIWHSFLMLMFRRDPQYWKIMWRREWALRWPDKLGPAPGVCARRVKRGASVPVRGEAGVYGE